MGREGCEIVRVAMVVLFIDIESYHFKYDALLKSWLLSLEIATF